MDVIHLIGFIVLMGLYPLNKPSWDREEEEQYDYTAATHDIDSLPLHCASRGKSSSVIDYLQGFPG